MAHPESSPEWADGARTLRRGWWVIALFAIGVGGASLIVSQQAPETERATGRLIVSPSAEEDAAFSPDAVRVLTQPGVIGTLTQILENTATAEESASDAGLDRAVLGEYDVSAQEVAGSLVVELHVDGPDAAVAESLASGVIANSTELFDDLYPVYEVRVLDPVRQIGVRGTPSAVQFGVLGALVGGGAAVLLLLALSTLRRSVAERNQDDLVTDEIVRPPADRRPAGASAGDGAARVSAADHT